MLFFSSFFKLKCRNFTRVMTKYFPCCIKYLNWAGWRCSNTSLNSSLLTEQINTTKNNAGYTLLEQQLKLGVFLRTRI